MTKKKTNLDCERLGPIELDNKALKKALNWLRQRDFLSAELSFRLLESGIEPDEAFAVVNFLTDRRILDDQRTIENAVARNSGPRAVGNQRLRETLIERGATEDKIDSAFSASAEAVEFDNARTVAEKRKRSGGERWQTGRYLESRGFEEHAVEHALDVVFGLEDAP